MKKVICFLAFIFILSGCGTTSGILDKDKNAVYPPEAETTMVILFIGYLLK